MKKSNYHHGNLREKLLKTTLKIISEEGLQKVSMRKLGALIGVSRTAPYRHFKNKGELLSAIAENGFRKLTDSICSVRKKTEDPVEQLKNIGVVSIEFALENPVQYRLMFGHEIMKQDQTPEFKKIAEAAITEVFLAVERLKTKDLLKPIEPMIIANTLWALIHGISTLLMDGQINISNAFLNLPAILIKEENHSKLDVHKIIENISALLFFGILK